MIVSKRIYRPSLGVLSEIVGGELIRLTKERTILSLNVSPCAFDDRMWIASCLGRGTGVRDVWTCPYQ